jgi:hypothetical protein
LEIDIVDTGQFAVAALRTCRLVVVEVSDHSILAALAEFGKFVLEI